MNQIVFNVLLLLLLLTLITILLIFRRQMVEHLYIEISVNYLYI